MNQNQNEILLQSGTNEIEIFEFSINSQRFGINTLKVRHVVQFQADQVHELPMMPPGMLGTIVDREEIIKVIDLRKTLKLGANSANKRPIMILSEFNRQVLGFVVDEILGIQRVGWEQVQSPSAFLKTSSITGVAVVGNREISMLDLESIVFNIFGLSEKLDHEKALAFPDGFKILVADDSPMIRKKIKWLLDKLEAKDVEMFENGALLHDRFMDLHAQGIRVGLVLTDLEMPQVDGFACCKKIKAKDKTVPVVVFSSLVNEQITRKCQEVGANVAVNKGDFSQLSQVIREIVPLPYKNAA